DHEYYGPHQENMRGESRSKYWFWFNAAQSQSKVTHTQSKVIPPGSSLSARRSSIPTGITLIPNSRRLQITKESRNRSLPANLQVRSVATKKYMGKKKKAAPIPEEVLHLPAHDGSLDRRYPYASALDVRTISPQEAADNSENQDTRLCKHSVDTLIDVWCEAPVDKRWRDVADSARDEEQRKSLWGGIDYWFVMGLDYHYMNSPADVQRTVFRRQLQQAVALGKPITVHTREADEDIEAILKEEVPKDHKYIGRERERLNDATVFQFKGVITYSTNLNTAQVVREMTRGNEPFNASQLRIVLETDAPYMVPANLYDSLALPGGKSNRLALSHSGMIPWTAGFVAGVVNENEEMSVDANDILEISKANARLPQKAYSALTRYQPTFEPDRHRIAGRVLNHRNLDAKVLPNGSEMYETDHKKSPGSWFLLLTTSVKAELLAEQPRSMVVIIHSFSSN
ncbi:254_t:CDS:10, partial [Acaulospora colombiana]